MPIRSRRLSALSAAAVAVVGLAACGGAASGQTVARVRGVGTIDRATLEHWMPIEAKVIYKEFPTTPVPKGIVPDPPSYSACIAYLQATPEKIVETGPKPSTAQLKVKCQRKLGELRVLTLNTLIGWYWIIGAGMKLGMKASNAEVQARIVQGNKQYFPKPGELERYLKLTGQTRADLLLRAKVQVFETKLLAQQTAIEKQLPAGASEQQKQAALANYEHSLPPGGGWVAKTSCSKGYVVSACRQYRGSQPPGIPN
jgi:foldase protein PrsA